MRKNKVHSRDKTGSRLHPTKPALLALAITQALALQAAQAASIEVTSNLDDGTDCTLREALTTVNSGTDQLNGCVITGDVLGTNDTVTFSPAVSGQTITTTQGELQITKDVSINPGGVNTTIDGNQATSDVMTVTGDGAVDISVTLNQLTITNGNGHGISVLNSYSQQYVNNTLSASLTNSTITGNTIYGIRVFADRDEVSNVTLTDSTVSGNGFGISTNTAFQAGADANLTLTNSTVSDNNGLGIYAGYSDVYLTNSTVSGNGGHGIRPFGSGTYLTNSTVSGNSRYGIYGYISQIGLVNSTVSGNSGFGVSGGSGFTLENSIIANNSVNSQYYGDCDPVGMLAGPDTITTTPCGGATVADPLLGPLANNGGPTQTHALLAGSPAIDNGTGPRATASDQRGVAAQGVRDSGAYEFTVGIETMGRPSIDRSTDTGLFIWENEPNNWVAHVVSGDMQRIVDIDITSTQALSNVQQVSIEASDVFTIFPSSLSLSLNVQAPWLDGVEFTVEDQSSTCISTANVDVPIYVGPNRVQVGSDFDLNTLTACGPGPDIETMGRPNIDRSMDTGIFIWENETNNWVTNVVSGDTPRIVDIDITSTQALSNVEQVSIEASDVVTILPSSLSLSLNVQAPWLDGVKFTVENQSSTCISTANVDVPIYVGPNRVEVGNNFDLNTLTVCESGPDIKTIGKPNIDRSTDTGIFIWESQPNDWVSHVVSGDMQRIIEVDVNSSDSISNAQEINIEASDVFTVLPNGLDLSLNVNAPWLDGFTFTELSQANTCVSTTNNDVLIYVGPDRIQIGNSVNLNTLMSCP